MTRMPVLAILGIVLALAVTFGLGWGLAPAGSDTAHVVPPTLASAMLAVGLVLIGAGFIRRN